MPAGSLADAETTPPSAKAARPSPARTRSEANRPGFPAGAIDGGFYPKKPDWPAQHPSIVIAVDDVDASMASVTAAGGKVLGEPISIPGIGLYVSFLDTEGNRNSMLQPTVVA